MPKFHIYASIKATKYLGEVEADTAEEAVQKGWESETCYVSVCHQCSRDVEDPEIDDIFAEEGDD